MAENIRTGDRDIAPDAVAHIPHVKTGNSKGHYEKQIGHRKDGKSTALRSTGINPKAHDPILPTMPNLSPP